MTSFLAATGSSININLGNSLSKPSTSVLVIIALTLLAIAPSLLILLTGFTRIVIVFGLTRQALGLQSTPAQPGDRRPGPDLQPVHHGPDPQPDEPRGAAAVPPRQETITQAYHSAQVPLKTWMLKQTGHEELALTTCDGQGAPRPNRRTPSLGAIIPAFVLSELKSGFIIGFVIFIPFLIIDLVVASTLMSMGVVMLPPTLVSLPFKLLLFVMVNGWVLVTHSLVVSFR